MEAIFEKMLKAAVSNLRQLESKGLVKYKVICGDDQYGDLEVVVGKPKRKRAINLPLGAIRNHVLPYLDNMQPGDLVEIPYRNWPPENIRSNACAYATGKWGRGTYTSTINRKNNVIELYRYPLKEVEGQPL